jgi:plastocyanin
VTRQALAAALALALGAASGAAAVSEARTGPAAHAAGMAIRRAPSHARRCTAGRRRASRRGRHAARCRPAKRHAPHGAAGPATTTVPVVPAGVPAPASAPVSPATSTTPAGPAPAGGGSAPPPSGPARLQVTGREFSLTLSRPAIVAGPAVVEFLDFGQDPHDLHIRASSGQDVAGTGTELPGSRTDLSVTLGPGTYTLYCSLPNHEAAGMHATLVVQ